MDRPRWIYLQGIGAMIQIDWWAIILLYVRLIYRILWYNLSVLKNRIVTILPIELALGIPWLNIWQEAVVSSNGWNISKLFVRIYIHILLDFLSVRFHLLLRRFLLLVHSFRIVIQILLCASCWPWLISEFGALLHISDELLVMVLNASLHKGLLGMHVGSVFSPMG
jgi:hypothetical protein